MVLLMLVLFVGLMLPALLPLLVILGSLFASSRRLVRAAHHPDQERS